MKRLLRIEQAKARGRMAESGGNISTPVGKSRDITAEQFGISGKTMEKEITIVENKDLLSFGVLLQGHRLAAHPTRERSVFARSSFCTSTSSHTHGQTKKAPTHKLEADAFFVYADISEI